MSNTELQTTQNKQMEKFDKKEYLQFLQETKNQIFQTRFRSAKFVNKQAANLYLWLGKHIVDNQEKYGWGKSIVKQLSIDLNKEFTGTYGFSERNLWNMRKIYLEYKGLEEMQQLVAEVPWGHNLMIVSKISDIKAREYYLKAVREYGWSRNILTMQINSQAYERQELASPQNNFNNTLSEQLALKANEAMKDIYIFDTLGITGNVLESVLEKRMVDKIRDVLLELGYGFSFIGNQYKVSSKTKDYYLDLLLFNRKLKSLVVIELKAGAFKPEYAGKMNFYLNLVESTLKEEGENPPIGIILCAEKDHVEVEFSLKSLDMPIGISEFKLTKKLPEHLRQKLPSTEQLSNEILKELQE